jgi:hypothetical protein
MKLQATIAALGLASLLAVACSAAPASEGATESSAQAVSVGGACTSASQCKGALPDICEASCNGGPGECAHFACVSNKCEVQICPPPPPECKKASDCKGPLPELCKLCDNGKSGCAHHECDDGQCVIDYCPAN